MARGVQKVLQDYRNLQVSGGTVGCGWLVAPVPCLWLARWLLERRV